MPADDQPQELTGSQLAAIRTYTGNDSDDIEIWVAHVTRVQKSFNWNNDKTGQIAENKLTDKAAKWLEARRSLNDDIDGWTNLQKGLMARFKKEISDVTAALAVGELQQKPTESVDDFYDRCVLTLKKKNHRVNDELRNNDNFKEAIKTDLYVFFGGGLKKYIRNATIYASSPPDSVDSLLTSARRVELQTEAKDKLFELEELTDDDKHDMKATNELNREERLEIAIANMTEELNALKSRPARAAPRYTPPGNNYLGKLVPVADPNRRPTIAYRPRPQLTCWNCGKAGHFSRSCRLKPKVKPDTTRRYNEVDEATMERYAPGDTFNQDTIVYYEASGNETGEKQ